MKKKTKTVEHYLGLPYPIELTPIPPEDGGGWEACIPQLGRMTTVGTGDTPEEALENLEAVKRILFDMWIKEGRDIPEPRAATSSREYSGRVLLRTTPALHRFLVERARKQGVSLNLYLNQVISLGFGVERQGEPPTQRVRRAG